MTVTGAPKTWAMRFVEKEETSPRVWYGGAVGYVGFDGSMNTGLTLRTIRVVGGVDEVRAGATLLFDSDPAAEEAETELKASALIDVLTRPPTEDEALALSAASFGADGALGANAKGTAAPSPDATAGPAKHILLVDHEDSFVYVERRRSCCGGSGALVVVAVVLRSRAAAALSCCCCCCGCCCYYCYRYHYCELTHPASQAHARELSAADGRVGGHHPRRRHVQAEARGAHRRGR